MNYSTKVGILYMIFKLTLSLELEGPYKEQVVSNLMELIAEILQ